MGNIFSNWDDKGDDLLGTEPKEPVEPLEASDGGLEKVVGSIAAEIGNSVKTEMVPPPADDRAKHPTDETGEILTKERVESAVVNGSEVKVQETMGTEKETIAELTATASNEPKENEKEEQELATSVDDAIDINEPKEEGASIENSASEPKNEGVKAEEPKEEEAKGEEEPKEEEPKGEEEAKGEEPRGEEPKEEEAKEEEPKGEEPKGEEEAKEEEPKGEEPKAEVAKEEEPKGEEAKEDNAAKQLKPIDVPVDPKPPTVAPVLTAVTPVGSKDAIVHPVQGKQKGGAVPKMKKSRIVNVTPVALEPKKAGTRRVRKKRTE